jgi:hypothetical protein
MTTGEFIDQRTEELRRFFQGRFGRHWVRLLRSRLERHHSVNFFIQRVRPSSKALYPVEALAISLGFKPTRLDLSLLGRKKHEKLAAFKRALALVAVPPGSVDDKTLTSMVQHKLRPRLLRDDVFPAEFVAKWCEATG